jgi:hypothetical protein
MRVWDTSQKEGVGNFPPSKTDNAAAVRLDGRDGTLFQSVATLPMLAEK